MTNLLIRFRYIKPAICQAQHGHFVATVDSRAGPVRKPHRATLERLGQKIASDCFGTLSLAQAWLRDQIKTAFDNATTFELADYATEQDLEDRFKRRAAAVARRRGLSIISVTEHETRVEHRPTIVRTYHCLRAPTEGRA
jgi:hypothetical protein